MFPVLFRIPNAWEMPGEFLVIEVVLGIACLLAWLALHLRGKKDGWASVFNTGFVLVVLHLALSHFMEENRPIVIYSFGVMIILGFLAGSWYMLRQTDRLRLDRKKIFDWGFWMLIVGIIGARFLYAFLNYEQFEQNKWELFKIWNGGLVWYGGLIPAAIVGVILLWRNKLPLLHVSDIGSAAIILALGIGRWACLLAGDDFGRPTDAWYGIRFYSPEALVPPELLGVPLHPTQLYMSVNCLWLFFILEWIRRRARFAGQAFAWMLILYAVSRSVLIEPFRGDFVERNPGYGKHVAVSVVVDKPEDSPAVSLARGAAVRDATGRTGVLLTDLDLPAGQAYGEAPAISDAPVKAVPRGPFAAAPDWDVTEVDGLPAGVAIRAEAPRWYRSDLPVPPGYVSTSQWISIFIIIAGVAILLIARKVHEPGYTEAVETIAQEPAAEAEPAA